MPFSIPLIPGTFINPTGLLARYLPHLPREIAAQWLKSHLPAGSWILDPFGTSPALIAEAAQAGYRVLVAANNPISRFLIEVAANPPSQAELRAVLADLAVARKGEERLEPYIRSLYQTTCAQCGNQVMAEAYSWEKESPVPYARSYSCSACGDSGEHAITQEDIHLAARFSATGLDRALALEKIAPVHDPLRSHAEEALLVYLPRAVHVLFTLINKLDSLAESPNRRRLLSYLMLNACEQGSTLWPNPRPRQLIIYNRFRENNIWLALETAISQAEANPSSLPLCQWPDEPPQSGGISLFEGRLRDLEEYYRAQPASQPKFEAVLSALPRPNQAYWTLSALWAGWLWGRQAVGPFISVLRRRRYDWAWHCNALYAAFNHLVNLISLGTPFFALTGEAETDFLSAILLAGASTGFELEGLALRVESGQAQFTWRYLRVMKPTTQPVHELGKPPLSEQSEATRTQLSRFGTRVQDAAIQASQVHLQERGEPAEYLQLHTVVLAALAKAGLLSFTDQKTQLQVSFVDFFELVQANIRQAFHTWRGFIRFAGSDRSLEVGQWWLVDRRNLAEPLVDRLELQVMNYLHQHPGCSLPELDAALCASLQGLLTPEISFSQICLGSYGMQPASGRDQWFLRPEDDPASRQMEIIKMRSMLAELGERLGYNTYGESPLIWAEPGKTIAWTFYILTYACFSQIVFSSPYPPKQTWIVLPGSRAGLVSYKLSHNPHLNQTVSEGWRFLKFRHVHRLVETATLTRLNLDEQLNLDPITVTAPQMRML